ncbi:hypothetical protein LQG66_28815 [Bradyrhizobium ontarionense]|uniref:Uncharacterized protein n=1 Tax=Bradyrhizobium ontarionense TaxID=2898149 RepID=A0ABY3R8D1_9BRAD|nr:hypothetical protein [Bradyrhizobium sp. A19]UFZ03209.1 hypothetical protein LQG66_28815 [Bradyrhizobium sp. A19]
MADLHAGGSQAPQAFDPLAWREGLRQPLLALYLVPLASFAGAFLGCLATLHLTRSGVPPALASATATLLLCAALIVEPTRDLIPTTFSSSAYGGSFSGMTSIVTLSESVARAGLPASASFILLSVFCGLVFCTVCAIEMRMRVVLLRGYGGRFGALAAVGSFLFLSLAPLLGPEGEVLHLARLDEFDKGLGDSLVIFASCLAGMFATIFALRSPNVAGSGRAARIFTSAAVAFLGLAILQQLRPGDGCLVDAYYAGCFLGMSSSQRLRGLVEPVVAAAALTVFLVQASAILPSVGGSLGFAAFIVVVAVDAARRVGRLLPLHDHPAAVGLGRGLAAALAVAGLLLPNSAFHVEAVVETTGSIPRVETSVAARAPADLPDEPAAEATVAAAPSSTPGDPPPAADWKPDILPPVIPPPVATPVRNELPRPRHASRSAPVSPRSLPDDPGPWRIIHAGQPARPRAGTTTGPQPAPAKRGPMRVVVPTVVSSRPASRSEPQRVRESQPAPAAPAP